MRYGDVSVYQKVATPRSWWQALTHRLLKPVCYREIELSESKVGLGVGCVAFCWTLVLLFPDSDRRLEPP